MNEETLKEIGYKRLKEFLSLNKSIPPKLILLSTPSRKRDEEEPLFLFKSEQKDSVNKNEPLTLTLLKKRNQNTEEGLKYLYFLPKSFKDIEQE